MSLLRAAAEREFNYLRDKAIYYNRTPIERLASCLVAISNMNFKEGRELSRVTK